MAQLVDKQVIRIGGQGFFAAFQGVVTLDTVTGQEHAQAATNAVARTFLEVVLHIHDSVGIAADEFGEPGLLECFVQEFATPHLHCERVVHAVVGISHDGIPVSFG